MQAEGDRGCSSLGQTTDGRQGLAFRVRGADGWVEGRWMEGWGGRDRQNGLMQENDHSLFALYDSYLLPLSVRLSPQLLNVLPPLCPSGTKKNLPVKQNIFCPIYCVFR